MLEMEGTINQVEVHDQAILSHARDIIDACNSPEEMQEAVLAAVSRNEEWRGKRCINLLAPEALTSPTVRGLLSSEVGTRAAEGHIGPINRWFAGTQYIDEIEALSGCWATRVACALRLRNLAGGSLEPASCTGAVGHQADVSLAR